MLFQVPEVLTPDELTQLTQTLTQAEFIDGKLTAGWHAKLVKHNQQLAKTVPEAASLKQQIKTALNRHPLFQIAVRPKTIHSILFSRYTAGMSYGLHVDNALMAGHRSDVSFTVFLSAPEEYSGGELVIAGPDDEQGYRLTAGSALVYPSTTLHRVDPVTQGERLVAVGWAQSWVRDAAQRELLFDLETARRSLFAKDGKTPEFDLLSKSMANLLRRWCD
ncbi:PKHD-type hydroxylase [Halomicronema hongdechloris C2206]|uniref:PKHD-type hydroxylase n=1 Tax=Halomicronema hongdechloris C2206 TaxID=1641165 RepID=A0A1Z3HKE9_9CYAN|nr:Fe2+-dependent dioxygenase [Halomicronema hongdechloris]ASC70567.1 PKHD-type hydroxylase [Halomicronema hongdechloris C2206]